MATSIGSIDSYQFFESLFNEYEGESSQFSTTLLEKPMKAQRILNAIQATESNDIKTVGCIFCSTKYATGAEKVYTYKYDARMLHIEEGDFVVVETLKGLAVVKVVELHEDSQIDGSSSIEYKWLVDKVTLLSTYYKLCEEDANAIKAIKADMKKQEASKVLADVSSATVAKVKSRI